MTNLIRTIILACCFCLTTNAQILWQFEKDSLITWHYQEGDEFNGGSVNKAIWSDWYGWARSIASNIEQQYYTNYKNHFVKDGKLILTAKPEIIHARYVDWMGDNDSIFDNKQFKGLNKRTFTYSAGMIQSRKDFLYGYFEIKFKIPKEKGFWPAFWLYGGTPNEEIDWMELKTEKYNKIHDGRHCQKKADNYVKTPLGKKVWGDWVKFEGSLNEGYNVISGIWTANSLKYYLNGECIAIAHTKMDVPKKLVANIAVSSNNGSFPPAPAKDFKDSVNFEIDYIRVWNRNNYSVKRMDKRQYTAQEPVTGPVEIAESKLLSKTKMHYGKKSEHVNDGFFASWMPQMNGKYQLTVLGKDIPSDGIVTLTDEIGKVISKTKLKYGVTTYDLSAQQSVNLKLRIQALGKESSYDFMVN